MKALQKKNTLAWIILLLICGEAKAAVNDLPPRVSCRRLSQFADLLKDMLPENTSGLPSSKDFAHLKGFSVQLESDPLRATQMTIRVDNAEKQTVKRITIPWEPNLHRQEIYFKSAKLKDPVFLKRNADVPKLSKVIFAQTKYVLSLSEPKFIQKALSGAEPLTQTAWYTHEHEIDRYAFLAGKRQIRSLYELQEYSWPIDPAYYSSKSLSHSITRFDHHQVRTTWINDLPGSTLADRVDLGLDALLLDLKKHKTTRFYQTPFAHSVHFENSDRPLNLHFLDLKLKKERELLGIEDQWLNVQDDLHSLVRNTYEEELNMDRATTNKLNEFTTQNADRIQYVLLTEEASSLGHPVKAPYAYKAPPGFFERVTFQQKGSFKHFKIKGSMGMIYSTDPVTEPLSLESYAGIKLDRKPGEKVAELIRLIFKPEDRDIGPRLAWKMSSYLMNVEGVSRVFAITAKDYAQQLIDDFGFKKIANRISPTGSEEWVIQITPGEFFEKSVINPPKKTR